MRKFSQNSIKIMVLTAILTAMVIVLQLLGSFIKLGMFSISLVLIPIIIGAAICGVGAGAWLGLVFGVTVLLSGDAAAFLVVNPFGTIVTVLAKGILAGLVSGVVYKAFVELCNKKQSVSDGDEPQNISKSKEIIVRYLPVIMAAVVCPIVNTGIFLVGCNLFFYETVSQWGMALGYENAASYMILGLAGGNFIFEFLFNLLISPTVVRILDIFSHRFAAKTQK